MLAFSGFVYFYLNVGVVMTASARMIEIKFLNIQFSTWEHATRAPFFEPCKFAQTFSNDHAIPFHQTVKATSAMI